MMLKHRVRNAAIAAVSVVAVSALVSCGSDEGADGATQMSVIKATPSFGDLPLHIVERATGAENGLSVESQEFEGAVAGNAFAGGEGDLLVAGIDKAVVAKKQGLFDPAILSSIMNSNVWVVVVPSNSGINTMADLDGKKVSISGAGSVSDAFMRWALIKEGIDPDDDVEIIGLGAADAQLAGLDQGQVDAGLLLSPILEGALDSGKYKIVEGGDWREVKFPSLVVSARAGDVEESPEKFQAFRDALADAMDMIANDPDRAAEIAAEEFSIPAKEATELIKAHLKIWQPDLRGELTPEAYDSSKDILDTSGLVTAGDFPSFEAIHVSD